MLLSLASTSKKNPGDASVLISLTSIKGTFVLDIWTAKASGFKSHEILAKRQFQTYVYKKCKIQDQLLNIFDIFTTFFSITESNLQSSWAFQSIRSCLDIKLQHRSGEEFRNMYIKKKKTIADMKYLSGKKQTPPCLFEPS